MANLYVLHCLGSTNTDWHDIQGSDNLETDLETSTRLHLLTNLTNAKHVLTLFHKDWKIYH